MSGSARTTPSAPLARWLLAVLACIVVVVAGLLPRVDLQPAGAAPLSAEHGTKQAVEIGMVLVELSGLDMKNDAFNATFWVWALSDGEQGDVLEKVDWANARSIETLNRVKSKFGEKTHELRKMRGVFQAEWDLRLFPVDRHDLRIRIESTAPADTLNLVYSKHSKARSYVHPAQLPGWNVGELDVTQGLEVYQTNFGIPRLKSQDSSAFSYLDFEFEIKRRNLPKLFNLLAGAFAAVVLVIASYGFNFKVPPAIPARFGLLAGSVFAVVISLRFASSKVFDPPYLTVIDAVHFVVVVYIFCALGASMLHLWTFDKGGELSRRSRRIDCLSGLISTLVMVGIVTSILARLFVS